MIKGNIGWVGEYTLSLIHILIHILISVYIPTNTTR